MPMRLNMIPKSIKQRRVLEDHLLGTPMEDAHRRDFTINSLFYDPFQKK